MNNLVGLLIALAVTFLFVRRYLKKQAAEEALAREAAQKGSLRSDGPQSQHPHIDTTNCIAARRVPWYVRRATFWRCLGAKPSSSTDTSVSATACAQRPARSVRLRW